ncbi:MAG: hypothetical protein IJT35_05310 [Paludibacteraceae bacterium]|nr:hypothetical protein [Paludibacteraceae bacterium]
MDILKDYICPIILAIIGGIISSALWWLMTRIICFPSFYIGKQIKSYNGKKLVEIKNSSDRYGGYNIEFYCEYQFSYKGRPVKYPLKPKYIYYLNAGGNDEVNVKIPSTAKIDDIKLEDAFYQSQDGKLEIQIVFQNKFGVKRSFRSLESVQKEEYPYQEPSE